MPASPSIDDAVLRDPAWQPDHGRRPLKVYRRTVRQGAPGKNGTVLEVAHLAAGWEAELVRGSDRIPLNPVESAAELAELVRVLERRRAD